MSISREIKYIGVIIIILYIGIRIISGLSERVDSLHNNVRIKESEATYWRDKSGRHHAEKEVAVGKLKDLKVIYKEALDSISNVRNAKSITSITTQTTDTVYVSFKDSLYTYKDPYLTFKLSPATNIMTYSLRSKITLVKRDKRGFLGFNKRYVVEAISENPRVILTGVTALEVQPNKKRKITFGLQAGYGITTSGLSPYVGLGIGLRLF